MAVNGRGKNGEEAVVTLRREREGCAREQRTR